MSEVGVAQLAEALYAARTTRTALQAPGLADLDTGYAVQRAGFRQRAAALDPDDGVVAGYKVALTSPEAQQALDADEPAAGRLLAADVVPSGTDVALDSLFTPLLEVELMFRLRAELPSEAGVDEVLAATDVAAGLECPDGRFQHWFGGDFPVLHRAEVVADNCLTGLVVVADRWRPAAGLDLPAITAELRVDGEPVSSGAGTEVLGHPARAVVWLAGHLAAGGERLRPGDLVSAGTFTPPRPATAGEVRATFSHGLGDVTVRFT